MIVLIAEGKQIIQIEQDGTRILYAVCDEAEKAIRMMYRGWALQTLEIELLAA